MDFAWFPLVCPGRMLLVVGRDEFETPHVKGITIEQFLLADDLPHPYPGEVDDVDVYNDLARFAKEG